MSLLLLFRQWFSAIVDALQPTHVAAATIEEAEAASADTTQGAHLVAIALEDAFALSVDVSQSLHLAAAVIEEELGVQGDALQAAHAIAVQLEDAFASAIGAAQPGHAFAAAAEQAFTLSSEATQDPHTSESAPPTVVDWAAIFTGPWRGRIRRAAPWIPELAPKPATPLRQIYIAIDARQSGHVAAATLEATPAAQPRLALVVDAQQRAHRCDAKLAHPDEELSIMLLEAA